MNIETSEMIKYFSNSFFALLISFGNQLGNFCEKINVDFMEVLQAAGWDNRFLTKKKHKKPDFLNHIGQFLVQMDTMVLVVAVFQRILKRLFKQQKNIARIFLSFRRLIK